MCGIFGGYGISVDESRKAIELIKQEMMELQFKVK